MAIRFARYISMIGEGKMMFRRTYTLLAVIPLLTLLFFCTDLAAQNAQLTHSFEYEAQAAPPNGRDFWFGIPQNFQKNIGDANRYFFIFITSTRTTTAYIQFGARTPILKQVAANTTVTLNPSDIPSNFEITSSDLIEDSKAVHIWSKDADLAVYFLSRASETSDGMYCIPTVGLGTEYVVGSYNSYPTDLAYLPSQFQIIGVEDGTFVQITPTADIRADASPAQVRHPKGQTFSVKLNKGQIVQYQTATPSVEGSDLTGTFISSTKAVGVIGSSVCPNVPVADPACDHIIDMLPPIRTWANHYFSSPFQGRVAGGDLFLVIGTKFGQSITRNGNVVATLGAPHDFLFVPDVTEASLWQSDTAFELIQYLQSKTHGTPTKNNGDPAMVVINPAEQYGKKIVFSIPKDLALSGQTAFDNILNIIVPITHEAKTTIDGNPLTTPGGGLTMGGSVFGGVVVPQRKAIPNTGWEVVFLVGKGQNGQGNHVIVSDTGVGLYIYGETSFDSYAWAGALGIRSPNSPDTLPPIAIPEGLCYCAKIKLYDNRKLDTKLSTISSIDTINNIVFYPDTSFVDGKGVDTSYYEICVIDTSKPAYISVSVYDIAGNRTTIVSKYEPAFLQYHPVVVDFGVGQIGVLAYKYDTICNIGTADFDFKAANLHIEDLSKGFVIDSIGADGKIPPGGCRVIKFRFTPTVGATVSTQLDITDGCMLLQQPIVGNGGAADFTVPDYDFSCVQPGSTAQSSGYFIQNSTGFGLNVDTIWVEDPVQFGYDPSAPGNTFPVAVPALPTQSGRKQVTFSFSPATAGAKQTIAHFIDKADGIEHTAVLKGKGCEASITSIDQTDITDCGVATVIKVPFQNIGNQNDQFDTVISSNSPYFGSVTVDDGAGNQINTPLPLNAGNKLFVNVRFTPPANTSGCFYDTLYLIHPAGDTAARGIAKVCATYRSYDVTRGTVDFVPVPFGSPKQQDNFTFCNTGDDPLVINGFDAFASHDSGAFRLTGVYKVNGVPVTLPITLPKNGDCVDVYIEFDPSFALDNAQAGLFSIATNACDSSSRLFSSTGQTTSGSALIQGFSVPPILACSSHDSSVIINNPELIGKSVDSVWIDGPQGANFQLVQTLPVAIGPVSKGNIKVRFLPNGGVGPQNYTAVFHAVVSDGSRTDTLSVALGGASNNFNLAVHSAFTKTGLHFGDNAPLAISLKLNKNGLAEPLSTLGIERVSLTYVYDINLLNLGDVNSVPDLTKSFASANGWVVNTALSVLPTTANPKLTLVLDRPGVPLTDGDNGLGTISFIATLPKTAPNSLMTLEELALLDNKQDTVLSCITLSHSDTSISIIYQCGDSTLFNYLNNNNPVFSIAPASPNPLTSNDHTTLLRYNMRREATVSLSVFDQLGNEVDKIENEVRHPAGSFQVYYDIDKLPSGSYVYRFTFDGNNARSGRIVIER